MWYPFFAHALTPFLFLILLQKMKVGTFSVSTFILPAAGQSYGVFSVSLSEKDKEQIYMEYEQMLESRKEEENMRLEQARLKQAAQKAKKKIKK